MGENYKSIGTLKAGQSRFALLSYPKIRVIFAKNFKKHSVDVGVEEQGKLDFRLISNIMHLSIFLLESFQKFWQYQFHDF